jgi:pimeloyl-ACP methyl ester carboxylesterase
MNSVFRRAAAVATRFLIVISACGAFATEATATVQDGSVSQVKSADGTTIVIECAGSGPSLLIVHGGTGDRTRWKPLFPLLEPRFRVCAMDRRAHGSSGDSTAYSLQHEVEDVVAAVNAESGPVFVLGHSFGGVVALEAALLTKKISKLVLYEAPVRVKDHGPILARMNAMISSGDREGALTVFMREIVGISENELAEMKSRPSWKTLLPTIETSIRQDRALTQNQFNPARVSGLTIPTLLLAGDRTNSAELKDSLDSLLRALPQSTLHVFEGQEHNAMDTVPEEFATTVTSFLLLPGH